MRTGDSLTLFSQIINFGIFIYFSIVLLRLNALDVVGLLISAFGLLSSLVASVVSAVETRGL